MAHEYFVWLEGLEARDYYVVLMGFWAIPLAFALFFLVPTMPPIFYKIPKWWLWLIVALGAMVRLEGLGDDSLWHDEAMTALIAQRPFWDILEASKGSAHPPLYYLFMSAWVWPATFFYQITPEWWLRFPSAIAGIATIPLTYLVAQQLKLSRNEAIIAALFVAINPFLVFYSREARMYAMLLDFALGAMWACQSRRTGWMVLLMVTGLYLHFAGMFLAIFTIFWVNDSENDDDFFLYPYMLSIALYTPWIFYGLMTQIERMSDSFWIQPPTGGATFYSLHLFMVGEKSPFIVILLMALVLAMVFGALAWAFRERRYEILHAFLAPMALSIAISYMLKPIYLERTMVASAPYLMMLLSRFMMSKKYLVALYLAIVIVSLSPLYGGQTKWPNGSWSAEIASRAQDGDAVLYVSKLLPLMWYNPSLPRYGIEADASHPAYGFQLSNEAARAMGIELVDPLAIRPTSGRLFVVLGRNPGMSPEQEAAFNLLLKRYPVLWRKEFVRQAGLEGHIVLLSTATAEDIESR